MAEVITTDTAILTGFPYAGITDLARDISDVPRREVRFAVIDGAIAAGGAGNTQTLRVNCLPEPNFAYVIIEAFANIDIVGTNNFQAEAVYSITDDRADIARTYFWFNQMSGTAAVSAGGVKSKIYRAAQVPQLTVTPAAEGDGMQLQFTFTNFVENDNAYTYDFFCRLLQYDIEQANHFAVNSPSPVR